MLCQKCGLNEATVHRESVVFRQKIEEHLCELCAGVGDSVSTAAAWETQISVTREVILEDERGDPSGPSKEIFNLSDVIKEPSGLTVILSIVGRLFVSKAKDCAVLISTVSDEKPCILVLVRQDEAAKLMLHHYSAKIESKIMEFFSARGIPLQSGAFEVVSSGRVPLGYPLTGSLVEIANLVAEVLGKCFGVDQGETLNFCFSRAGTVQ